MSLLFTAPLRASSEFDPRLGVLQRSLVSSSIARSVFPRLMGYVGHSSPILCAAFSPTGNFLATGSGDMNVRLWDLNTELPSHTLSGHVGWVLCVEWEAMERKLASGGHDGRVSLTAKPFSISKLTYNR